MVLSRSCELAEAEPLWRSKSGCRNREWFVDPVINYDRLYEFRFRGIDRRSRQRVWDVIADDIHRVMGRPKVVLDVAGGTGEFINAVPAQERWLIDWVNYPGEIDPAVKVVVGNILEAELPEGHFDGVFVSNFLEHLLTQDSVAEVLGKLRQLVRPGGVVVIMGPNFRYCSKVYFDCADHTLALTHVSVEEHLHAAGFDKVEVRPKYLPYSFRGLLPPSPKLTRAYLKLRPFHAILGKQFLLIAERN
jgi:SAM-dependent methyltransferase